MRVFSLLSSKEMPSVGISQEVLGYEKLRVILSRDEVILPRVKVKAAFGWEERAQSQAVHLPGAGGGGASLHSVLSAVPWNPWAGDRSQPWVGSVLCGASG